ncbi:MAG: SUMF1/EgtB/PvdO family nonheme iron enzyme, partial [Anaerolineae bacterium]|nr:SUMF1/EgtB/PvdO family nonheme iron enzyme [Anaerolineae bacterium]
GLDEVADADTRKQVVAWAERQMTACHKNRFVVTSRPHGYRSNPLSRVTVLEVAPFDSDQVRDFVGNWYLANEIMSAQKDDPGVRMKAREGAEDLLRRIRNTASLSALAVNPLLLTMIANVHRYRSSLPGRRVELYAEICEVFLGKRQAAKGLEADLTPAQKRRVLQPLAYEMMCRREREIGLVEAVDAISVALARVSPESSGKAFLGMIENTSGVLLERESGVYGFAHQTFQEYLAAVHVQEARLEGTLVERVEDSWWHEAVRLYCAQADATPIIRACLTGERPSVPALVLAIECLEEAREVQPDVRVRLEAVLKEDVEDADAERRRIVAEALLRLGLRRMVRVSEDKYIGPKPITHAEYQLFLDEQRARGKYYQPDHWLAYRFAEGEGHKPVVGVRPSDAVAFCEWLTERETGPWRYRLPERGEIEADGVGAVFEDEGGIGYWCASGEISWLAVSNVVQSGFTRELLYEKIAADIVRALDLNRDRALDRDLDLDRALDNALYYAFDRARSDDLRFNLDLDRALDRALDIDIDIDI